MWKDPLRRTILRSASSRRGTVTLEFALVLPVLLMMILASIEFGRAMMIANVLTTAAREGARGGVLPTATNTEVLAAVNGQLAANSILPAVVSTEIKVNYLVPDAYVVQNVSTATTGNRIRVQVSVPYNRVSWLPTPQFLAGKQLSGIAVMRRE